MKLFIFIFIVLLSGCQKYFVLSVSQENGNITFTNKEIIEKCTNGISIYDFEVILTNKQGSFTAWSIVKKSRLSKEESIFQFPVTYGKDYQGVKKPTIAKKLLSGVYKVGATFSCLTSSDSYSLTALGSFAIDGRGKVITDEEEIKSMEKNMGTSGN